MVEDVIIGPILRDFLAQAVLREETDRIGLRLDTTHQSGAETVESILSDLDASRVRLPLPR